MNVQRFAIRLAVGLLAVGVMAAQAEEVPQAFTDKALYLVIELSGGTKAKRYPVRYSPTPPNLKDDACRTTEMWFRLIPPGTFMMGSPDTEFGRHHPSEDLHQVTLTKPFYMGIFEVTQKQWRLVMGRKFWPFWNGPNYYKGDLRPVEWVSYETLRGAKLGAQWPAHNKVDASSFFGTLRAKTSLMADLPTEAQWEYACRAGTATSLNSGKDLTATVPCPNLAEVGRWQEEGKDPPFLNDFRDADGSYLGRHTKVGMYKPNVWGLYDMHGNVSEWCLDWWQAPLGTAAVTDPQGAKWGRYRVFRGGCFCNDMTSCRSASRSCYRPGSHGWVGFRIVILPAP